MKASLPKVGFGLWLLLMFMIFITMLPILLKPEFGLSDNGIAYLSGKYYSELFEHPLKVAWAFLSGQRFEEIGRYRPLYFFEQSALYEICGQNPAGYWLWLFIKIILILSFLYLIIAKLTGNYFISFIFASLLFVFPTYRWQINTYETQETLQAVFFLGVILILIYIIKKQYLNLATQIGLALISFFLLFCDYFYKETTLGFAVPFIIIGLYILWYLKRYFWGLFFSIINFIFVCLVVFLKPVPNLSAIEQDYVKGFSFFNFVEVFISKLITIFTENPIASFLLLLITVIFVFNSFLWIKNKKFSWFLVPNNFLILSFFLLMLSNVGFLSLWGRGACPKYDLIRAVLSCILLAIFFKTYFYEGLFLFFKASRTTCSDFFSISFIDFKALFVGVSLFLILVQWYYNFRGTYRDYFWIHRDREMMRYLAKNCEKNATIYQNFVSWEQNVEMVLQLDHFMGRQDLIFFNALSSQCPPYGRTNYTLGCYLDDDQKEFNYILVDNAWERFKKPIKPINKNYTVVFENKNWSIYKKQT